MQRCKCLALGGIVAIAASISACDGSEAPDRASAKADVAHREAAEPRTAAQAGLAAAVADFYAAVRSSDSEAVCERLSARALARMTRAAQHSCKKVLDDLFSRLPPTATTQFDDLRVTEVAIHGRRARVTISLDQRAPRKVTFVKEAGVWKQIAL